MVDRKAWRDRVTSFLSLITLGFDVVGLGSGEVDVCVSDFWGLSLAEAALALGG